MIRHPGTIHHHFRYRFDLACLYAVRRSVREIKPDVIHAWGPLAIRVAAFLPEGRFVVSHADRACDLADDRCLRRTDHVLATNEAEKRRYVRMSVPTSSIRVIPPGIPDPSPGNRLDVLASLSLPESARYLIASGNFDQNAGLKFAVWAFDIVRYLHPNLHLVLLGDGPQRPRVESFSRKLGQSGSVRFVGFRRGRRHRCSPTPTRRGSLIAWAEPTFAHEAVSRAYRFFAFATADWRSIRDPSDPRRPGTIRSPSATDDARGVYQPDSAFPSHFPMSALASAVAAVYDGRTDA